MRHHFKEILVIHNRLYNILNVIRNVRVFRNHSLKFFWLTSGIIRTRNKRSILHIIGRQEAEQFAYGQHGFFFSVTHEVSNATLTAMCIGSTQFFLVHFFMRNRFHYIRPCDEHMTFLFHHKNKIRQCRWITGTAGTWTQNSWDLRDHPGSNRILIENRSISWQTADTFLNTGTSRVIQSNNRSTIFEC